MASGGGGRGDRRRGVTLLLAASERLYGARRAGAGLPSRAPAAKGGSVPGQDDPYLSAANPRRRVFLPAVLRHPCLLLRLLP